LEESLLHLIKLRASQINGCADCLDMHWKDLRAIGETEQRLYSLDAWRECPYYTDREFQLSATAGKIGGPSAWAGVDRPFGPHDRRA
jgi:AhpD family alkylhydroperoxidase